MLTLVTPKPESTQPASPPLIYIRTLIAPRTAIIYIPLVPQGLVSLMFAESSNEKRETIKGVVGDAMGMLKAVQLSSLRGRILPPV